jgi:ParB-like chromosome segregation protein Spo0J
MPGAAEEQVVNRSVRRVEKRNVCDLKPFPLQEHFFTDESEEADCELAANMRKNGLRERPEILPDNTIIKGHRRTGAAKHNGWTEIEVVVRYDLVGNEKAIEEEFLEDNYMRRQMSPLLRAKCAKRLDELARDGKLTEYQLGISEGLTRAKIGRLLGVSGETVGRWLRILRAPLEVQLAYDAKKLGVEAAARACNLNEKVQEEIAAEIKHRGFEHAKGIVEKHMPKKAETRRGPGKMYMKFKQAGYEAFKEGLADNVERIGWQPHEDVQFWEDVEDLAIRMRLHIEEMCAEDSDE